MKTAEIWIKENYPTESLIIENSSFLAIMLEKYATEQVRQELIKFLCSLEESTFYSDRKAEDIVDYYLTHKK